MRWISVGGSWSNTNLEIENKVREVVREIFKAGNGLISGGALGVDYIALDEALKQNPAADKIKIYIPTTLETYSNHYRKHAKLGAITEKQAENLIQQLTLLKKANSKALIENPNPNFTEENKKEMYYERNTRIVETANELVAFPVKTKISNSPGTRDAIEKAKSLGIPVKIFEYDLTNL